MSLKTQVWAICFMMAFSLSAGASSLNIQKKSSSISNDLFNQIDSDIESSRKKINKRLADAEIDTQGFDEVKVKKTAVVVPATSTLKSLTKVEPKVEDELVKDEVVPDVVAEHISDSRTPASVNKVYKNASIDDELSSELEGL